MNKILILFAIGELSGLLFIIFNKFNNSLVISTGILMIALYFMFNATLPKDTNIWSYIMSN